MKTYIKDNLKLVDLIKEFKDKEELYEFENSCVFDEFYKGILNYFESELIDSINNIFKDKLKINEKNIIISSKKALRKDLISICSKTLIGDIFNAKSNNMLIGQDSKERYEYYNSVTRCNMKSIA